MGRKNKTKAAKNCASFNASALNDSKLSQNPESPQGREADAVLGSDEVKMELMTVFGSSRIENLQEKFRIALMELDKKDAELECAKKVISHLKKEDIDALKQEANIAKANIEELSNHIQFLESSKNEALTQLDHLKNKLIEKDLASKDSNRDVSKLNDEINDTKSQVNNAQCAIADLERKMEETNQLLEKARESGRKEKVEMEKLLEGERMRFSEVEKELHDLMKKEDSYRIQNEKLMSDLEKSQEKLKSLEDNNAQLMKVNKDLSENTKTVETTLMDVTAQLNEVKRLFETERNSRQKCEDELRQETEKLEASKKSFEAIIDSINADVRVIKSDFKLVKNNLAASQEENQKLIDDMKKEAANGNNQITSLQNEIKEWQDVCNSKEAEIRNLKQELELTNSSKAKVVEDLEHKNKRLRADLKTAENKKVTLVANNTKLKEQLKELEENLKSVESLLENERKKVELGEAKMSDLDKMLNEKNESVNTLSNDIATLRSEYDAIKSTEEDLRKELASQKSDTQMKEKLETRIEELKRSSENQQKRVDQELQATRKRLLEVEEQKSNLEVLVNSKSVMISELEKKLLDEKNNFDTTILSAQSNLEKEKNDYIKQLEDSSMTIEALRIELKTSNESQKLLEDELNSNLQKLKASEVIIAEHQQKCEELISVEKEKLREYQTKSDIEISEIKRTLEEKLKSSSETENQLRLQLSASKMKIQDLDQENSENKVECLRLRMETKQAEEVHQLTKSRTKDVESELILMKEKVENLEKLAKEREDEIARITELETKKTEILVKVADDEKKALERSVADLRLQLDETTKEIKEQKNEAKRLVESESYKTKKAYKLVEEQKKSFAEKIEELTQSLVQKDLQIEDFKAKFDRLSELDLQNSVERLNEELSTSKAEYSKLQETEREIRRKYEEEVEKSSEFDRKSNESSKKLEIAKASLEKLEHSSKCDRDRISQLELRLETIQGSSAIQQKRLEEELSSTRQKLEKSELLIAEKTSECQKLSELENRLQQLQTISEGQKDLEMQIKILTEQLELANKEKLSQSAIIAQLESQISNIKDEFNNKLNDAHREIEESEALLQNKIEEFESLKMVSDQSKADQTSSGSTIVEVDQKSKEAIVNLSSDNTCVEEPNNSFNSFKKFALSFLESSSHPIARQLSRRVQMMRYNSSFAIYPYVRYIIAVYVIILHVWLVFF